MDNHAKILNKALGHALSATGAHVGTRDVFVALDWKLAGSRLQSAPHTVYQLLNHMLYWQEWAAKWLEGRTPPIPKHASGSWPGKAAPAKREEWERRVRQFHSGLEELTRQSREAEPFSRRGNKSRLEMFHNIASHNSYHAGQVALLRQMQGAWPLPSGGLT